MLDLRDFFDHTGREHLDAIVSSWCVCQPPDTTTERRWWHGSCSTASQRRMNAAFGNNTPDQGQSNIGAGIAEGPASVSGSGDDYYDVEYYDDGSWW